MLIKDRISVIEKWQLSTNEKLKTDERKWQLLILIVAFDTDVEFWPTFRLMFLRVSGHIPFLMSSGFPNSFPIFYSHFVTFHHYTKFITNNFLFASISFSYIWNTSSLGQVSLVWKSILCTIICLILVASICYLMYKREYTSEGLS